VTTAHLGHRLQIAPELIGRNCIDTIEASWRIGKITITRSKASLVPTLLIGGMLIWASCPTAADTLKGKEASEAQSIERDPTTRALDDQIEKCTGLYGDESNRRKEFANCQSNCSKHTDDKIRLCIDACQALADQFSKCANQGLIGK
jgi:hypothetical protein